MPDCSDQKELLLLDVYDELDAAARAQWEEHLKTCAECRREKEKLTDLLSGVRDAMVPPPLAGPDSAAMIRRVQNRLKPWRLVRRWRARGQEKRTLWVPALASACLLVLLATWVGFQRPGDVDDRPVAQKVDNSEILAEDDEEIIKNLELLKNFNTLEKLSRVVDAAAGAPLHDKNSQGTQGDIRYGRHERTV